MRKRHGYSILIIQLICQAAERRSLDEECRMKDGDSGIGVRRVLKGLRVLDDLSHLSAPVHLAHPAHLVPHSSFFITDDTNLQGREARDRK
jgi:hypothetical protein